MVGPLAKINLIVGQNNSGKSNILKFVREHYARARRQAVGGRVAALGFGPLDAHQTQSCPMRLAVSLRLQEAEYDGLARQVTSRRSNTDLLDRVLDGLRDEDGVLWFGFRADSIHADSWHLDPEWLEGERCSAIDDSWWRTVAELLTTEYFGDRLRNASSVVRVILNIAPRDVRVALVPAMRQIGSESVTDGDFSGRDIVTRLADLQHPSIHEQIKQQQFAAINDFLRSVLDDETAALEIPIKQDTVHVQLGRHKFPLEHLGTGIHEVTMLAAWATIHTNQVLCIEEPELHLHPLLQKKLLRHLDERTSNQYLMTTHSAHILEHPDAAIFHVRWDGEQSVVERALTSGDRVRICDDLGYRASDLLQTNAVIWVEGPSDRLYIRHWLRAVDPTLIEGVHYSIMFYGGRLLSHLSADDPEVNDFISLRQINQHLAIVIDSDQPKRGANLNATKQRVRKEFDKGPGFAWVTKGREIENYLPVDRILAAVQAIHPSTDQLAGIGQFDNLLRRTKDGGATSSFDKVKIAHAITEHKADLSLLDLKEKVTALAHFIQAANGLKPGVS